MEFPRLYAPLERTIFRIVQEAMTNVFRHAGARTGCVTLVHNGNGLRLTVRDDGKGVPEEITQLRSGSIGVGIGGMRERVREFGGQLRVANAVPGTLIEVSLPALLPGQEVSFWITRSHRRAVIFAASSIPLRGHCATIGATVSDSATRTQRRLCHCSTKFL